MNNSHKGSKSFYQVNRVNTAKGRKIHSVIIDVMP